MTFFTERNQQGKRNAEDLPLFLVVIPQICEMCIS